MIKKYFLFLILFLSGCVGHPKEYVAVKRGFVSLEVTNPIGKGQLARRYWISSKKEVVNYGDNKQELINKFGLPDSSDVLLGNQETYCYKQENICFILEDSKVVGFFKYVKN